MKHPDIEVQLSGTDGNSFVLIGRVARALKRGGVSPKVIEEFRTEATSGDRDHLLQTCMDWVDVS